MAEGTEGSAPDIEPQELIDAINDPEKAQRLMDERGLTKQDLAARAEQLANDLSAGVSAINVV